jgi:3-oxoadipate enol-lactonase
MTEIKLQNLSFAEGQITAVRTGSGPDLIIIHSLLADRAAFDPVLPWLAQRYRVTLVNLPGFHGSKPITPGIENYADHVAQIFESGDFSKDAIVMANGFGGTVAVAMALRHGTKFGRLVLSDVAASFPPEGAKAFEIMAGKVEAEGIGSVATISANRVFHAAYLEAHPQAVDERRNVLLNIVPEAFVAACRTLMGTDLVGDLGKITNPTLVLCGELDAATPPALCKLIAERIPGAKFIELKGCGHCPPLEQPDQFIAAVAPFVA